MKYQRQAKILELVEKYDIETQDDLLEKLKEEDLPFLCESAAADACAPGNPRPASLEQFEEMFRKLM